MYVVSQRGDGAFVWWGCRSEQHIYGAHAVWPWLCQRVLEAQQHGELVMKEGDVFSGIHVMHVYVGRSRHEMEELR